MEVDSQGTPRKAPPPGSDSGAVHVRLDETALEPKEAMDVLGETIETCKIPTEDRFELLCRIRAAKALAPNRVEERVKLITARLIAVAIFGHTHNEAHAQSSLLLYEPDIVIHVAELLQLDHGIPVTVQMAAIAALDALARYRNKMQEVLTAVNAGVNHGLLMTLVRKMAAEVADPNSTLPQSFVEALLSFVTFIASHAAGGNMVVGAGLIPLLIEMMGVTNPQRLPVVSKTMQLIDNVLYSFNNSFQLFCNSRGVEVLVERIEVTIYFLSDMLNMLLNLVWIG